MSEMFDVAYFSKLLNRLYQFNINHDTRDVFVEN